MKIVTLFIAILFLAIIGLMFTLPREETIKNYKTIVIDIVLVLIGFSLAVTWDIIKDTRNEKSERESIVVMLQSELGSIHGEINENLKTLEKNLLELEIGKEVVRPLLVLDTAAWESAKLRNGIFIKNTGDLFKMVNLYAAISIINEKIRFRENYRMTNQAMSNYNERLKIIDDDIKHALENMNEYHKIAQEYLHKAYPLIVKGYNFSLNTGIVKEAEGK